MIIGILQTGHLPEEIRADHGNVDRLFMRLLDGRGLRFRVFRVVDMEFPASPGDADAWLITGSKHGVYEDHPFLAPLERLIRAIHTAGRPLVGVCFGHQIVAQALGGRVEKFAGGWTVGRQCYSMDGRQIALNAWHQDQVVRLPTGAEVLATSPGCEYAVTAYGDRTLTVQAHPEFGPEIIRGLIAHRGTGTVPEPLLEQARLGLSAPLDIAQAAEMLARVLEGAPATRALSAGRRAAS